MNKLLHKKGRSLSFEEVNERDRQHIEKICNDDMYAYNFFYKKCEPLFKKILWTIYGNDADYDELVNDLYLYLKKPNADGEYWHNLQTFDYRTSLFDWLKTVAVRHFYTPNAEVFEIPEILKDTALLENMICDMGVSTYRKYMWNKYVKNKSDDEICVLLDVESQELKKIARSTIKCFKGVVANNYPEYSELFSFAKKNKVLQTDRMTRDNMHGIEASDEEQTLNVRLDVNKQISLMPNERYRYLLYSFFIEGKSLEELAKELQTSVDNIYNIKKRSMEQFEDVYLFSEELEDMHIYITRVTNDGFRQIIRSIFVQKKSYDEISAEMGLTESQFKKEKKAAIKELKRVIFNKPQIRN